MQGVNRKNETSRSAQTNKEFTFRIQDVRTLDPFEERYCRLCAVLSRGAVHIFERQGKRMDLANKINMNLPITVTERSSLPLHVCWDCIKQLNASINFVNKCVHSQLKIENMFKVMFNRKHSNRTSLVSDKKNIKAEGSCSISRPISNQLLSKEITSKDRTHLSESSDLNEIIMIDTSKLGERNEEKRNRQSSSSNQIKHNGDENIFERTLQEIPVLDVTDSDNENNAADNILENTEGNSAEPEQNSSTSPEGFGLKDLESCSGVDGTKAKLDKSTFEQKNELKYQCQYCEEGYEWKADLFQHQTFAHPALVFCCSHCSKIFYESKEDFIRHEKAHELAPVRKSAYKPWKRLKYTKKKEVIHKGNWEIRDNEFPTSEIVASTYNGEESIGKAGDSSEASLDKPSKDSIGENSPDIMPGKITKGKINSEMGPNVLIQSKEKSPQGEHSTFTGNAYRSKKKIYRCKQCKVQCETLWEKRQHRREQHVMTYPCRFCPRTLKQKKQFDRHEAYHLTVKKHNCRKCSVSYDTVDELKKHNSTAHPRLYTPRYTCETCSKSFHQKDRYLKHIQVHSSSSCYLCEVCGRSFSKSWRLNTHRRTSCIKHMEKKLSCKFCGRMFHIQSQLKSHLRIHTGERPFLCSICGKAFRETYFKKHMESHSVARHACSFCGLLFKRRYNLVNHLKLHSECTVCHLDYGENIKAHLLHMREFHSVEAEEGIMKGFGGRELAEFASGGGKTGDFAETMNRCETCGRFFASSFWMRSHQENHCGDRPIFRCPHCDKIMRFPETYRKHLMMHSDEKSFQCCHCPQKFDIYKDLLKHEKEHKDRKPYSCPECSKTFSSSIGLNRHLNVHAPAGNFSCNICDKTFTRQLSLTVHKRKRHEVLKQVYPCSMCLQTFSHKRLAQMHERSHVEVQKQSTENASVLVKDYNLNLDKESFAVRDYLDNVAGEVLIYDSQSIESTYSEIIIVSDKMDDDVIDNSVQM